MSNPYSSKETAIANTEKMIADGKLAVETDSDGYVWIYTGNSQDKYSIYAGSLGAAVLAFATDRARLLGYTWAWDVHLERCR